MTDPRFGGDLRGGARRRIAKIAVTAVGVAAFGVAGLSGALAQDEDAGDVLATGTVGGAADISVPAMDILGEDFWEEIFAGLFPTGGTDELVTVPTGGSGGDINVGGTMGGEITVGSGGSGGLSISGPSTDSGSLTIGGGTSSSNSGSGSDDGFYE